ncbi:hypothetical protein BGX38DRAFT_1147313 [Terfezia claveryi]|nr:hypothetical protein BGX38DRAFT_1147313 [Terfezia claveryi]
MLHFYVTRDSAEVGPALSFLLEPGIGDCYFKGRRFSAIANHAIANHATEHSPQEAVATLVVTTRFSAIANHATEHSPQDTLRLHVFIGAKVVKHFKPFSVTMQPLIQDILDKEMIVERYAGMATMGRIKENSAKLQQVHDVIMQVREEMKRLDDNDKANVSSTEILNATKDVRETVVVGTTEILNATKDVKDTLMELVVQALEPQQREILSNKPLDLELQELKTKYLKEAQQTNIFHANLYVPAQGMASQYAPEEEHFGLYERIEKFLAPDSPHRVCLIQGAAGAGKSTFNHYLAAQLCQAYDNQPSSNGNAAKPIPVFIPLANLHDATRHNQDLIAEMFKRQKWPKERIMKARE